MKAPTSVSYQDYLISHLKDPNYAATYLEAHLEEGDIEPELLRLALSNVRVALSQAEMNPEKATLHQKKLNALLAKPGEQAVCELASWLNELGLQLTVIPKSH